MTPLVRFLFLPLILLSLGGCAVPQSQQPILKTVSPGTLMWVDELPVLIVKGDPYDMGYQHGTLLRNQVRASVNNMMGFADQQIKIPLIGRWMVRRALMHAWNQMAPFVPEKYLDEMKGLADGAGIPLETLQMVHALPERMAAMCASAAVTGAATRDGTFIHIRNLDWAIQSDVQRYAALFVFYPEGAHPFISVGWLGFVGVVSGMNDQEISVSEIGAETVDVTLKGTPMAFLLRQVLEESSDLDQAAAVIQSAARTGGYNYLFADARKKKAIVLETTHTHAALFSVDKEPSNSYTVPIRNAIFRSDWAIDPAIRDLQKAARGNPHAAGTESPAGCTSYDLRYRGLGLLLNLFFGRIDPEIAMSIARAIAPKSNIQSVVFSAPWMWVANASGRQPAALRKYIQIDALGLLSDQEKN